MKIMSMLMLLITSSAVLGAENGSVVESLIDLDHSRQWTRFAEQVMALHRQQLKAHSFRAEERIDRYGGEMAKRYRYREVSYYEVGSGRLLSRIRWDRDQQDVVQIGEVYIYDDQGRIQRDYSFIYLPWGRGAPIRTYINLHAYHGGLHAFRQFDASGEIIFERCEGQLEGRQVEIALPEERLGNSVSRSPEYRQCFMVLGHTAGVYMQPQ